MPKLKGGHNLSILEMLRDIHEEHGTVTPEGGRYLPEGVTSDDPRDRTRYRMRRIRSRGGPGKRRGRMPTGPRRGRGEDWV